jgi:hypothetical protein
MDVKQRQASAYTGGIAARYDILSESDASIWKRVRTELGHDVTNAIRACIEGVGIDWYYTGAQNHHADSYNSSISPQETRVLQATRENLYATMRDGSQIPSGSGDMVNVNRDQADSTLASAFQDSAVPTQRQLELQDTS